MLDGDMIFTDEDVNLYGRNDDQYEDDGTDEDLAEICQELLLKKTLTDGEVKSFDEEDALPRYFHDWGASWKRTAGKGGNILHRLLLGCQKGDIDRIGHLEDAVTFIVRNHPPLLWENQTKDNHDSPLWLAVKQKEATMVTAFMRGVKQSQQSRSSELEELLKKPVDPDGRSMLQWAIDKNLEESAIQEMLFYVSDEALAAKDSNGRTPLHAALVYRDCTDDRVTTIQQMILRAKTALSAVDNFGRSIYAHHLWTQQQWLERKRILEEKAQEEETARLSNDQSVKISSTADPNSASKPATIQAALDAGPKNAKESQPPKQLIEPRAKRIAVNPVDSAYNRKGGPKEGLSSQDPRDQSQGLSTDDGENNEEQVPRPNQGSRRDAIPERTNLLPRVPTFNMQDQLNKSTVSRSERDEQKRAEQETKARSRGQRAEEKRAREQERLKKKRDEQERLRAKEEERRKPETLEANSQLVKLEIKLRCMRTLSPKETARILYGNNPKDRQICFDFPGRPTIRREALEMSFQNVKFDDVLQYVAFPSVKFEKRALEEAASSNRDGLGRKEMVDIFEWLRKKKNVKRIVKVIVNDYDKPAHSDRAIVKSLKGFHVEELQWLKTDLDPQTILNISKEIRKLRLRWSGSNTALRAWSDPYGLRKLPHLDSIQLELVDDEALENYEDMRDNIVKFEARMNLPHNIDQDENTLSKSDLEASKRIKVKVPAMNTFGRLITRTAVAGMDMSRTNIENHKWLETMDNFSEEMIPVWEEARKRARKVAGSEPFGQPVIVALIDDGVDVLEPSLQGKLIEGKTLSYDVLRSGEPTEQREHAFWESSGGHGTVMANMIFRVCPMAKLYVIRMETHLDGDNGRSRINAHSAAEAINAALDRGVNIISMSWTVSENDENIKDSGLQEAVARAAEEHVLLFASSSDGGHYSDNSLPIALRREAFFRVGAAKADGKPFDWAGPVGALDYTFPGVDVIKASGDGGGGDGHLHSFSESRYHEKLAEMGTETGSSVATALAAGTAAMLLTCARMAVVAERMNAKVLSEMQKRNNMMAAFDRLGNKLGENKFIEVWQTLDTRQWSDFRERRPAGKLDMVATIIVPLLAPSAFRT